MRRNTKKKAFQCDILDIISLYHLSSDVLPALDSSDDEDDVPLVNLLKKIKDQKQSEQTAGQSLSSEAPQTQHVIFPTRCISVSITLYSLRCVDSRLLR